MSTAAPLSTTGTKAESGGRCYLVTGATGWVGRHVVAELATQGDGEIIVLARRKGSRDAKAVLRHLRPLLPPGMAPTVLEIVRGEVPELPDHVTHVIHCAALVDFVQEADMLRANVGLTWDLLLAASRLARLKRFVHASTLSIRADGGQPFAESSLDAGQSFVTGYALTKYLAEVMIRKFHRPLPVTVLRLGSVLATSDGQFDTPADWLYQTVRLWIEKRVDALPLGARQRILAIPVDVLARAVHQLLGPPDVPDVLHLPYDAGPTVSSIFRAMGAAIGRSPPALLPQHSSQWRRSRRLLPATARRMIDRLYPPPPRGLRLAPVDSQRSRRWCESHRILMPPPSGEYWARIARHVRGRR